MAYYKASYVTDYKEYFSLKPDYDTEAMEVYVYTTSRNDFPGHKSTIFYNPTYSLLGTDTVLSTDWAEYADGRYKVYKYHHSVSTISGEYTFDPYIATSYNEEYKKLISSGSEWASLASTSRTAYSLSSVSNAITSRYYSSSRSTYSYNQYSTYTATSLGLSFTKSTTTTESTLSVEAVETVIFSDWHSDNFYVKNYKSDTDGVTVTRTNDVLVSIYNIRETTDEQGSTTTTFSAGYYDHNTLSITTIQSTSYYSVYTNVSTYGVSSYKTGDDYFIKYNVDSTFKASYSIPQDSYTTSVLGYEFIGNIRNTGSTVEHQSYTTETAPLELYGTGISSAVYFYRDAYDYMYLGVTSSSGYSASSLSVSYKFTSSGSSTYDTTVADLASISSSTTNHIGNSISVTTYITSFYTHSIPEYSVSNSFTKSAYSTTIVELSNLDVSSTYTSLDLYENVTDSGYTYKTSFYGTIEAGLDGNVLRSETSWVNIAQAMTSLYTVSEINYLSLSYKTIENYFSSFGVIRYNISTNSMSKLISEKVNNPKYGYKTEYKTSTELVTYVSETEPIETTYSVVKHFNIYSTSITAQDIAARIEVDFPGEVSDFYDRATVIPSLIYTSLHTESYKETSSSSSYNTARYGTTARVSDMISSSSWVNVFNTYLISNVRYAYNISSLWIYSKGNITETLSEYSTMLATSFKHEYDKRINYKSVSFTASESTNILTTEDRYINRNGIFRYETNIVSYTNTAAYYNGSAMATLSQESSTYTYNSETSVSRLAYTFITSSADFSSVESVITTGTASIGKQQFRNSFSTVMNSTSEQQNDTLIFQSTVATISTYNASITYSTLSTMHADYEATTYTDEYNPITYSSSYVKIDTSLDVTTKMNSVSDIVRVTQSIGYTPVYSDVNGIYVTQ